MIRIGVKFCMMVEQCSGPRACLLPFGGDIFRGLQMHAGSRKGFWRTIFGPSVKFEAYNF